MWPDFAAWTAADWSALFGGVTALVAVIAMGFAARQVGEARRTREEQAQPFVVVDLEPSPVWSKIINLVVENVGATLAREVRLSFEPRLSSTHVTGEWALNDTVLLKEGVAAMPPGRRIVALFDLAHERYKSDLPMTYKVRVEFKDARGRPQEALSTRSTFACATGYRVPRSSECTMPLRR